MQGGGERIKKRDKQIPNIAKFEKLGTSEISLPCKMLYDLGPLLYLDQNLENNRWQCAKRNKKKAYS